MWAPSALRVLVGLVALADVRASVQAPLGAQHAQHDLDSESPITFTPFSAEAWARAADRASELAAKMTREEKLNITRGVWGPCQAQSGSVPRLGVPGFCYNDGPAGVRSTDFVTQYPSQFTSVMAWDRDLMWDLEERIAQEFVGKGVNVELGPLTGGPLGRSPFNGRNWEAFTPDPYLSSQMSYIAIRATQGAGLVACAKHYFLYEQSPVCDDKGCKDVHAMVDDKTVKELYLPSFAEAVRAGVGAIMCSYNQINDTPACQSHDAMTRILRDELNFQGYVLSDFGATHSTAPSANAGMDQELPGTYWYGDRLRKAVEKGDVTEDRLTEMAMRVLRPWFASGQADSYKAPNYNWWSLDSEWKTDDGVFYNEHFDPRREDAGDFARRVAEESHVLLKNKGGVLPISDKVRRIGVFGTDADYPTTMSGCGMDLFCMEGSNIRHWNGTITVGGGSGAAYGAYIVPPIEAISRRARASSIRVDQVLRDDEEHYPAIRKVASSVELCLVFVGVFLVEGSDRAALKLDNDGEKLILQVADACGGDVVVVMHAGAQVVVEEWVHHPRVKGVIFAGYPGQESGNALVNVLWGDVDASGRLAFTMGKKEEDWPTKNIIRKPSKNTRAHYTERLAIDYKWFDTHDIEPRWEFGFGLSYTTFKLSDLGVEARHEPVKDTVQPTNEAHEGEHDLYDTVYVAHVTVENTGDREGKEVAQLYMSFPETEKDQPPRHLRGFQKVGLKPGEAKVVEFPLRKKDLATWDVERQLWRIPKGKFTFSAGHSSRNRPLEVEVDIE